MLRAAVRRLRIAFDLAETNFDRLNAKGMERVRRDVGRFLLSGSAKGPGAETGRVWVGSRVPALSDRELQTLLQLTVRRLLDALVARVPLNFPDLPRLDLVLSPVAGGNDVTVTVVEGSASDRFMFALLLLLAHVGAGRVRACPGCGGAFLKLGRRTHCSRPECRRELARAYWRRYKNTPAGRRAHERHMQRLYETVYVAHGWTPGARSKRKRTRKRRPPPGR